MRSSNEQDKIEKRLDVCANLLLQSGVNFTLMKNSAGQPVLAGFARDSEQAENVAEFLNATVGQMLNLECKTLRGDALNMTLSESHAKYLMTKLSSLKAEAGSYDVKSARKLSDSSPGLDGSKNSIVSETPSPPPSPSSRGSQPPLSPVQIGENSFHKVEDKKTPLTDAENWKLALQKARVLSAKKPETAAGEPGKLQKKKPQEIFSSLSSVSTQVHKHDVIFFKEKPDDYKFPSFFNRQEKRLAAILEARLQKQRKSEEDGNVPEYGIPNKK